MAELGAGLLAADLNNELCAIVQLAAAASWRAQRLARFTEGQGIDGLAKRGMTDTAQAEQFMTDVNVAKTYALIWTGQAGQPDPYGFDMALAAYAGTATLGT